MNRNSCLERIWKRCQMMIWIMLPEDQDVEQVIHVVPMTVVIEHVLSWRLGHTFGERS